jgi:hypothetical protein
MPHDPLQAGPLAAVAAYDLSTPGGLALLRRFDAQFHRLPAEARAAAARRLPLVLPLAERAEGLLVLPGGGLAWRSDAALLVPDPGSAIGVTALAPALWAIALAAEGAQALCHGAEGLRAGAAPAAVQAAVLLPDAGALAALLPAVAEWRGPALLHRHPGGAVLWELVPAPPGLALAASLCGEALPEHGVLPRFLWAMGADDRYQHLSTGLAQHLDEHLAAEVSDALRFALVADWTDGEDSRASPLADALGLLPAGFAADPARPAGSTLLQGWDGPPPGQAMFGLAAAESPQRWDAALRQSFLQHLRADWPGALIAGPGQAPLPLDGLAADRLVRGALPACAALLPLAEPMAPALLLQQAEALALALGVPLLLAAPCWGLSQWLEPAGGRGHGNGAGLGLGAGLEFLEES